MLFLVQKTKLHRQQKIPDEKKKTNQYHFRNNVVFTTTQPKQAHSKASNYSLQITREVALFIGLECV